MGKLPQICQALQIRSSPVILLMARGQVAAALENDLSPQETTAFVERVGQMMGLKVELGGSTLEQLAEAEELEWSDVTGADVAYSRVAEATDLTMEARIRAAAGRARCALRASRRDAAELLLKELESSGHARTQEVKQAMAMLQLDKLRSPDPLEKLKEAATASPGDGGAAAAYAAALFWAGREMDAVDAALARSKASRRSLSSAMFV